VAGDTARALHGSHSPVVKTLDMARRASVSTSVDAKAFAYERVPAAVPPGADSVFAGDYLPGDPFGSVSASFTTDRSR
jgi:hypothetical protein